MTDKQSFFLQLVTCGVLLLAIHSFDSEANEPTEQQRINTASSLVFKHSFNKYLNECVWVIKPKDKHKEQHREYNAQCAEEAYNFALNAQKAFLSKFKNVEACITKARKAAEVTIELIKKDCIHPDLKVLDTGCVISKQIQIKSIYTKRVKECKSESN